MEKWAILELEQRTYKMSQEHLMTSESQKALKKKMMGYVKGTQKKRQLKGLPAAKVRTI